MMKNISIRLKEEFMGEAHKLAEIEMVDKSVIMCIKNLFRFSFFFIYFLV